MGLVAACAVEPRRTSSPMWIVRQGSHSGVVLPVGRAPLRPDVRVAPAGAAPAFVEYGYSDRGWFDGSGRDPAHLWRLLVGFGEGIVVVRLHETLASALGGEPAKQVEVGDEQLRAIGAELHRWVDWAHPIDVHPDATLSYVYASTRRYHLLRNCNTFTAALLRAMRRANGP